MKSLLAKLEVDASEFGYLLKFVTKNLSATDWREFLSRISLGEGANTNIVKALLALTVSYDNMIPDDYELLKKNYHNYREMREYIFNNLQLNSEIMELVYAMKRGRINNVKFLNSDSQLIGS